MRPPRYFAGGTPRLHPLLIHSKRLPEIPPQRLFLPSRRRRHHSRCQGPASGPSRPLTPERMRAPGLRLLIGCQARGGVKRGVTLWPAHHLFPVLLPEEGGATVKSSQPIGYLEKKTHAREVAVSRMRTSSARRQSG